MRRFVEQIAGKLLDEAFGPLSEMSGMDANWFHCGATLHR